MGDKNLKSIASFLHHAETHRKEVERITAKHPLTVKEAYEIQHEIASIKQEEGHRIIGMKMGLTSEAKMKQMNVKEPIYGHIFDYMLISDHDTLVLQTLIHPKAEAEIAFIMGKDLKGPVISGAQVMGAVSHVLPAIEIIDSRYENFRFTLPDVISDNASTSRLVLGNTLTSPLAVDLDLVGVTLSINGKVNGLGAGAAVLNHPANAVAKLINMLSERGQALKAGDIILSGSITEAIQLSQGDYVSAKFDQLGAVSFSVV